jgi:hypothetical protein
MIKKYNQFVKGRVNEDYDFEVESPVAPIDYTMGETENQLDNPPAEITLDPESTEVVEEEEEEEVNKYETALKELADAAGVEFVKGSNKVIINGKEVTFPSETEKYHITGVKKGLTSIEDVLANVGGRSNESPINSIKDEQALEDEMGTFESKSYKNTRLRKFRK